MLVRMKVVTSALATAAGLCFAATTVLAQVPGLTKDGFKCESTTGKTLTKFVGSKTKCAQTCLATARKVGPPFTDCFAPYGGATLTCITDPIKGAEAKAGAGIKKACSAKTDSCPHCYTDPPSGKCTDGTGTNPFVASSENSVDIFGPQVYCVESGAPNTLLLPLPLHSGPPSQTPATPSKTDAKCEDGLSKGLGKFVGAKSKCYATCGSNAFKGKIPAAACTPPATDLATQTCISNATTKATAALDKACFTPPATKPTCYDNTVITLNGVPLTGVLGRPNTSAGWVANVEHAVDATTPTVACGSPSGAFIN
jgi:hypothetical protein